LGSIRSAQGSRTELRRGELRSNRGDRLTPVRVRIVLGDTDHAVVDARVDVSYHVPDRVVPCRGTVHSVAGVSEDALASDRAHSGLGRVVRRADLGVVRFGAAP